MTVGAQSGGGERTLLAVSGVAGGVGAAVLVYRVADVGLDGGTAVLLGAAAYPMGLALGEWVVGGALGLDASGVDVVGRAALGTAIGVAAGSLVGLGIGSAWYVFVGVNGTYDFSGFVVGGLVGLATAAVVPAVLVSRSFEAAPAVVAPPTGETVPGLSLRLSL